MPSLRDLYEFQPVYGALGASGSFAWVNCDPTEWCNADPRNGYFQVTYSWQGDAWGANVPTGATGPNGYSVGMSVQQTLENCGDEFCMVSRNVVSYSVNPSFVNNLYLLGSWTDSAEANNVLRETLHPAAFQSRYGHPFGTGEHDYDFFERIAGPFNATEGAQTWQRIAHRVGWLGTPPTWLGGFSGSGVLGGGTNAKWYLQNHFRALVLSEFFGQPEILAAHGRVNWPAQAGISEASLQYEKDYVQSVMHNEAGKDADIGIMGYVTLAVMSFGIGLAVSAAIAAIAAEIAAAAAAETAAGIAAEGITTLGVEAGIEGAVLVESVTVGTETFIVETAIATDSITAVAGEVATNLAAKVATQEIMSLITTGDFADLDPLKLALSAGGQIISAADLGSIADLDASFPDVNIADVVPLVSAGWSIYDAYVAIDADPTLPQRPPPPPPARSAAPPNAPAIIAQPPLPIETTAEIVATMVTPLDEMTPAATFTPSATPPAQEVAIPEKPASNWLWIAAVVLSAMAEK